MDPIKYLIASGTIVGTFVYPGQVATNPGGPYQASGVLSIHADWINQLGLNWTLTINSPSPKTFFPSQFNLSGNILSAWVGFDAGITNWSAYTVTAVRNATSTTLSSGTSGLGGSLDGVDLTAPEYAYIPMALQSNLGGIFTKTSERWHTFVFWVGIAFFLFIAYQVYKRVK
jgi:hypothetical protein